LESSLLSFLLFCSYAHEEVHYHTRYLNKAKQRYNQAAAPPHYVIPRHYSIAMQIKEENKQEQLQVKASHIHEP
jgi:hypothetical protein